jgi:hypothetical protein
VSVLLKRFWTDHRLASVISLALLFLGLLIKPWTLVLVLALALGGPFLQRLETFSTSPLAGWRRSNWFALALVVGALLLALTGKSGGQGALILALLPVAWVLVTDKAILQGAKLSESRPATKAASEPASASPHEPDLDAGSTYTATKVINPLVGSELLKKIQELGDIGKSDLVRACGYVSSKPDGGERLNFTAFYEALLEAKGASHGSQQESSERRDADSNRDFRNGDDSLPSAEDIAGMVNNYLDEVIDENIDDFDPDGSYKVRPEYGYGKFYLDSVEGSYDMSLQGLIHYIMHAEDIYEEFLNEAQLNAVQECIDEYPEAIYSVDTSEGNGEEVEALLDEVYYKCICHVARRLKKAGLNVDAFADYLGEDDENEASVNETSDDSNLKVPAQADSSMVDTIHQPPRPLNIRNGSGAFSTRVIQSTIGEPDDDGDISIDLKLSLSSYAEEDVELVVSKLVVLTASGLPLLEREDEHDMLIARGSSEEISLYSGYFKASQIAGAPASDTQVLVQLKPCGCKFVDLPHIEITSPGNISGITDTLQLLPNVQLQGFSALVPHPDDDGECQLEFKGLLVNDSESALNKVVVSIRILDKNGREIDSTEWSDKAAPFSTTCIDTSLWGIKASRLAGARAHVSVKSFQGLGNQELSWSVGSNPEPIEAEGLVAGGNQQATLAQNVSPSLSADQASSLASRDIEVSSSNAFDLEINSATFQTPDDDGDTRYEVQYSVTNRSDKALELLIARLFVLHPSGLVVASTDDESEDMAENGEVINASSSTWGTSAKELDDDPGTAQLLLQVTACTCSFIELGSIDCPSGGSTLTLKPTNQNNEGLIVEAITITTEPPDDGECCVRFKALIKNRSDFTFPRVVISTKLVSSSGRELEDTYSQEELVANTDIVLEDSFWGLKENRINAAKLQFQLKAFAAAGINTATTKNLSVED